MMEYLYLLGAVGLLVRIGQGLFTTGLSRSKNAAGGMLRAAADLCVGILCVWAVGIAWFTQTSNGVIGLNLSAIAGWALQSHSEIFLLCIPVLIATGIVSGVMAERSRFWAPIAGTVALAALLVPLAGFWTWRGWLWRIGFIDVAGAGSVHVAGGLCAAVGALLVGPRVGKYNRDGSSNAIPGHSVPVALGGMLLMLVGWVPYVMMMSGWFGAPAGAGLAANMGLTGPINLGAAATNVVLAGAAGGLAGLLFSQWRYGKPDVLLSSVALLGGLVAICAGAGTLSAAAAVFIGAVAGIVVPLAAVQIDLRCRIDDPAGAIAVHVVGGAWGIIAAGLLAPAATSRLRLIGVQVLGLACIAGMALLAACVLFGAVKLTVGLRAAEADEYDGLDLAEHDLNAYPDFQQNMIKSYHLREA